MIKANELRIGNLFQGDKFSIARYGIHSDGVTSITGYGIYLLSENDNILDLKPIPLTKEILLKFGFERLFPKGNTYKINNFTISDFGKYGIKNFHCEYEIKYVHQLQNLYFALTGEELEINL